MNSALHFSSKNWAQIIRHDSHSKQRWSLAGLDSESVWNPSWLRNSLNSNTALLAMARISFPQMDTPGRTRPKTTIWPTKVLISKQMKSLYASMIQSKSKSRLKSIKQPTDSQWQSRSRKVKRSTRAWTSAITVKRLKLLIISTFPVKNSDPQFHKTTFQFVFVLFLFYHKNYNFIACCLSPIFFFDQ